MSNNASFTPPSLVLSTIGLSLATFMQVLDTTIANVALPTISGNLGVSSEQGTWVITSFAVSNAIALPLTGWLSRRFGEVKLFLWATILFVLASFLCGISTSMPELIGFRVLQGLVAGPLYPMTQTLLIAVYLASGRQHQIRRHLAAIGHPLWGDPRYGQGNKNSEGLALQAQMLAFTCPFTHKQRQWRSIPPLWALTQLTPEALEGALSALYQRYQQQPRPPEWGFAPR